MTYGFICGSMIIIWNNRITELFPRITSTNLKQPTHPIWYSDHRCHIPTTTSHSQTHQQSPRHSWICLTEIDLFCYGPVNPSRRAAIIMTRSHKGESNPNVKLTNTSAPGDHSDHMNVRICSPQQSQKKLGPLVSYHDYAAESVLVFCFFLVDMCENDCVNLERGLKYSWWVMQGWMTKQMHSCC